MSHESARQLLQEIANCPEAQVCRAGKDDHPCSAIVGVQRETRPDMFQRPEPWSGFLDTAPLLFISSNPSLSEDENYPTTSWTADMAPPGSSSRRCRSPASSLTRVTPTIKRATREQPRPSGTTARLTAGASAGHHSNLRAEVGEGERAVVGQPDGAAAPAFNPDDGPADSAAPEMADSRSSWSSSSSCSSSSS